MCGETGSHGSEGGRAPQGALPTRQTEQSRSRLSEIGNAEDSTADETGVLSSDCRLHRIGTVRDAAAVNHADYSILMNANASIGTDDVAGLDEQRGVRRNAGRARARIGVAVAQSAGTP